MGKRVDHVESCTYAAVGRVPLSARTCVVPVGLQDASELLVTIAPQQLHVFTRRRDRNAPACVCQGTGTNETGATTGALLRTHGFVCPHVAKYDDVELVLTVPLSAIAQVCVTYRTTTMTPTTSKTKTPQTVTSGTGVATRTKDLVVRTASSLVVWLEFEHNLARGWFLEALTAAAGSPVFEIDHLDLSDTVAVANATCKSTPASVALAKPSGLLIPVAFLRDAWRHVAYEKIKLALQVAHDAPATTTSDADATVACLLTSAMELSSRLDEPDLNAFTWLASGFLNLRSPFPTKRELARAQALHSLELARENSLAYLTCLALQCCAAATDVPVATARGWLTEATKLLTHSAACAAMEPALKMQLHAALHGLRDQNPRPPLARAHSVLGASRTSPTPSHLKIPIARSDSSSSLLTKDKKPSTAVFSLWAHVFGGNPASRGGGDDDPVKRLLLERVAKDERGRSFYVDVLGAQSVRKARFRVFSAADATAAWLLDHITTRYRASVAVRSDPHDDAESDATIALLYDTQRKQLVPPDAPLCEWLRDDSDHNAPRELHAKLAPRVVSSHRSVAPSIPQAMALAMPREDPASHERNASTVLCSLCGSRVALSDVEDHSEACFRTRHNPQSVK